MNIITSKTAMVGRKIPTRRCGCQSG